MVLLQLPESADIVQKLEQALESESGADHNVTHSPLRRLMNSYPSSPMVVRAVALDHLKRNEHSDAERLLERALESNDCDVIAWYGLTLVKRAAEDQDIITRSIDYIRCILPPLLELEEEDNPAGGQGIRALTDGKFARAEKLLKEALVDAPKSKRIRQSLVYTLLEQGKKQDAEKLCRDLLEDHPLDGALEFLLAAAVVERDSAAALGILSSLTKRNPGHRPAWRRIAVLEALSGNMDSCAQAISKISAIDGMDTSVWYCVGRVLSLNGKKELARKAFEFALELDEENSRAWYGLASVLSSMDDKAGADAAFDKARHLFKGSERFWMTQSHDIDPSLGSLHSWQNGLLQLDRRNNLLYLKEDSKGIVKFDGWCLNHVETLSDNKSSLKFDYAERRRRKQDEDVDNDDDNSVSVIPGDIQVKDCSAIELQKRLSNIRRKSREWDQEQGVSTLFIGIGLLNWFDEFEKPAAAPLLLMQCNLQRPLQKGPFELRAESDDIMVNKTLAHKLKLLGHELPDFDFEKDEVDEFLVACEKLTASNADWQVRREIILSNFSYTKLAMWEDLETIRANGLTHPLVRALAGDEVTLQDSDINLDDLMMEDGRLDDIVDPAEHFLVKKADFSQVLAVATVDAGKNLIIHGPPGTGKSQTIANLISSALAKGKKVLFVSEKIAALDVVKTRLEESSLGAFCLDLHSERGKKDNVYSQLQKSLDQDRSSRHSQFDYGKLKSLRSELNQMVRVLHQKRNPLGCSIYQVHGKLSQVRDDLDIDIPINNLLSRPENLTDQHLARLLELAEKIGKRKEEFEQNDTSPWKVLIDRSPTATTADQIKRVVSALCTGAQQLVDSSSRRSEQVSCTAPNTVAECDSLCKLVERVQTAPRLLPDWLNSAKTGELKTIAERQRAAQNLYLTNKVQLQEFIDNSKIDLDYQQLEHSVESVDAFKTELCELFGGEWQKRICTQPDLLRQLVAEARSQMLKTTTLSEELSATIGCAAPRTIQEIRELVERVRKVCNLSPLPRICADLVSGPEVRRRIKEVRTLIERLAPLEEKFSKSYSPSVLAELDQQTLIRFRTDHQSWFSRLISRQYKQDMRVLRGNRRITGNLAIDDAIKDIELAIEVKELREQQSKLQDKLQETIGVMEDTTQSAWEQLETRVSQLQDLLNREKIDHTSLGKLVSDPASARACLETVDVVDRELKAVDAKLAKLCGQDLDLSREWSYWNDLLDDGEESCVLLGEVSSSLGPLKKPITSISQLTELVRCCAADRDHVVQMRTQQSHLSQSFGVHFKTYDTNWLQIVEALTWAESFIHDFGNSLNAQLVALLCTDNLQEIDWRKLRELIRSQSDTYDKAAQWFDIDKTEWTTFAEAPLRDLVTWAENLASRTQECAEWLQYRQYALELDQMLGVGALAAIRKATSDAELFPRIVARRIYSDWLDMLYNSQQELGRFSVLDQEELLTKFKRLDSEELPKAAALEIRKRILAQYPDQPGATHRDDFYTLSNELAKTRRRLPIRKLMTKIPDAVLSIKPCFMMSPLAVSQHLPMDRSEAGKSLFDLVIFDEASQVFPEDAIPAIARASQVVVVGDQQQLPPSNFFRRLDQDDLNEDDDEQVDAEGALTDTESILQAMKKLVGRNVTERYLKVHYRSKHEDLIRFSNHHFYDNRLIVFPSAIREPKDVGVFYVPVENGRFDVGATRTNLEEAKKVVDLVFEHIRSRPASETLGVVTLSRAQCNLIDQLIQERRQQEQDVASRFQENCSEAFFVKNLERVQGDERDHIILSIGYGPSVATGLFNNRFGPINSLGGDRRLNVAITRARQRFSLVTSLDPAKITSENKGGRLCKRLLEFVRKPKEFFESSLPGTNSEGPDSEFEVWVKQALERRGHSVVSQVGTAGYRIDLAILSSDRTRFDLGIECDGAAYHSSPAARDRDWLRQSILESLGWTIHRVWSTSWLSSPQKELDRIERALSKAQSRSDLAPSVH